MTDISAFKKTNILVIGDVMLDRYCWGSVTRISPEAPVPIVRLHRQTSRPGGAANVAANAVALGGKVQLIGLVGDDQEAKELSSAVSEMGIQLPLFHTSPNRPTTIKTRIVAHNQQVVRLDTEDIRDITTVEADEIYRKFVECVESVDIVILSDYGKGLLNAELVQKIISVCGESKKLVLADPKGKIFEKYRGATILTPNRREAAEACKLEESDPDLVHKAGSELLDTLDLENVLITESENGMTIFQKVVPPVHFGTAAREVYDVTGAGDTVIACLGVALAAGCSVEQSAYIANIAAGLSVQHIGTVAVSFGELHHELQQNSGTALSGG